MDKKKISEIEYLQKINLFQKTITKTIMTKINQLYQIKNMILLKKRNNRFREKV